MLVRTFQLFIALLLLYSQSLFGISFDAALNTGAFEYRGPTERNGYLLGISTNLFLFSDLALTINESISHLESGIYRGQKYANEASLVNTSLGLLFVVDVMRLLPYIKVTGEFYKGNFLNNENYDYGYSMGAGLRYERLPVFLTFELSYKQLYKTTTEWPSIILFTIGSGFASDREKDREAGL